VLTENSTSMYVRFWNAMFNIVMRTVAPNLGSHRAICNSFFFVPISAAPLPLKKEVPGVGERKGVG
jgi:hypothetical protein